ncbi:unnamed protein product [Thelazia callipaeda]|uniref:Uncharacterized protein n=1 Tax=Thelazia callipaeda TaxID=103827 RepID=A0A0N5D6A6_THECL|nr:unnamed protein product [Thelazia callipaeda]
MDLVRAAFECSTLRFRWRKFGALFFYDIFNLQRRASFSQFSQSHDETFVAEAGKHGMNEQYGPQLNVCLSRKSSRMKTGRSEAICVLGQL